MRVFILYFIGDSLFAEAVNTLLNSWPCLWKASQKPRLSLTARTNVTFAGWNGGPLAFPPGKCILSLLELACNWSLANANVTLLHGLFSTRSGSVLGQGSRGGGRDSLACRRLSLAGGDLFFCCHSCWRWNSRYSFHIPKHLSFLLLWWPAGGDGTPQDQPLMLTAKQGGGLSCYSSLDKGGKFAVYKDCRSCCFVKGSELHCVTKMVAKRQKKMTGC